MLLTKYTLCSALTGIRKKSKIRNITECVHKSDFKCRFKWVHKKTLINVQINLCQNARTYGSLQGGINRLCVQRLKEGHLHREISSECEKKCVRDLLRLRRELFNLLNGDNPTTGSSPPQSENISMRKFPRGNKFLTLEKSDPLFLNIKKGENIPTGELRNLWDDCTRDDVDNSGIGSIGGIGGVSCVDGGCEDRVRAEIVKRRIQEKGKIVAQIINRMSVGQMVNLCEKVKNKDILKTLLIGCVNYREMVAKRKNSKITINEFASLFCVCSTYYIENERKLFDYNKIDFFKETPTLCKNLLKDVLELLHRNGSCLSEKELTDVVIACLKLLRMNPLLFPHSTVNDFVKRLSFRLYQFNRGATGARAVSWSDDIGNSTRDICSGSSWNNGLEERQTFLLGDLTRVLYEVVSFGRAVSTMRYECGGVTQELTLAKEHEQLVSNVITFAKKELRSSIRLKEKFFFKSCVSLLFSLTMVYKKIDHINYVNILKYALNHFYYSLGNHNHKIMIMNFHELGNFLTKHNLSGIEKENPFVEVTDVRNCLLQSLNSFINFSRSLGINFSFVFTLSNDFMDDNMLCLEEFIKLFHSLNFFQKRIYFTSEQRKENNNVRKIVLSLLPRVDNIIERQVLKFLNGGNVFQGKNSHENIDKRGKHERVDCEKAHKNSAGGNAQSLLKNLSHLLNILYEYRIVDLKTLYTTTFIIAKCKNVDLVVLSNILNAFSKMNFCYDTYFVSFYFANYVVRVKLSETVMRENFFIRKGEVTSQGGAATAEAAVATAEAAVATETAETATTETATSETATAETATSETATSETATAETATSETATAETATAETATSETCCDDHLNRACRKRVDSEENIYQSGEEQKGRDILVRENVVNEGSKTIKRRKMLPFYIWRAFLRNMERNVLFDEKKFNSLQPVNITKIVNGLVYYRNVNKKVIEAVMRIVSRGYKYGEDTTTKVEKRNKEKLELNLVCLSSLLNCMSLTEDIQCYDLKVKLVKFIKSSIIKHGDLRDSRLLCGIYISYARMNIYDRVLFYDIYRRLDIEKLNAMNLLSVISYMNKVGLYDGKILRICINHLFKHIRRNTQSQLSILVHFLFVLTSIGQLYMYESLNIVLNHIIYVMYRIYITCRGKSPSQKKTLSYNLYSMLLISLHTLYYFLLKEEIEDLGNILHRMNVKYLHIMSYLLRQTYDDIASTEATKSQIQKNVLSTLRQVVSSHHVHIVYEYCLRHTPYLVDMLLLRGRDNEIG
ncbi:conserved Plasmodium protein, unknown function [Plasmodium ovale]|uniref:Uncharacterized protein n=1 Tax=Plasmodium ovale TaxID=36330 RepID=A0A1D3RD33_PLAOA|nr:conserved Plasmodium protein, unknown function [Plasmodium ovale]